MSDREMLSPQSAILDIAEPRYGEKLKQIFWRVHEATGLGQRTIKRAYYDEQPSNRALARLFAAASERAARRIAVIEALSDTGAVDRETVDELRLRAGRYARRAAALGYAVGER